MTVVVAPGRCAPSPPGAVVVGDHRLADAVGVQSILVVEAQAGGDRQAVVRRPAILRVDRVVLIDVRRRSSSRCRNRPSRRCRRSGCGRRCPRRTSAYERRYGPDWPLMPRRYQSLMSSKPNLKSWLPALSGQVVGHLRLDLRLRPAARERVPAGAGLTSRRRRIRSRRLRRPDRPRRPSASQA